MFSRDSRIGISGLQRSLLNGRGRAGNSRGLVMVEWLIGQVLGLLLAGLATGLFLYQAQLLGSVLHRQVRAEDQHILDHYLRAELRRAGHRFAAGPSADHDQLQLEGGANNPSLRYLCDHCGATDRTRTAGLRIQSTALAYRHPGSSAHQALHDGRVSGIHGWRIDQHQTADCMPYIRIELEPLEADTANAVTLIRPRNLGLLSCEKAERPQGVMR